MIVGILIGIAFGAFVAAALGLMIWSREDEKREIVRDVIILGGMLIWYSYDRRMQIIILVFIAALRAGYSYRKWRRGKKA